MVAARYLTQYTGLPLLRRPCMVLDLAMGVLRKVSCRAERKRTQRIL
jgi:hypothetical protein